MEITTSSSGVHRFGSFEVGLQSGELRKSGLKVKLREQSFQILAMLLARPGEVVTREEIQKKLWPDGTFVDFDHSLNAAVNRLREALNDNAENPRFVETLPRRGYRFIARVDTARRVISGAGTGEGTVAAVSSPPPDAVAPVSPPAKTAAMRTSPLQRRLALASGLLLGIAAVLFAFNVAGLRAKLLRGMGMVREPSLQIRSIAVLPLENLSGDPTQEYFADGMTDELITKLGKVSALRVISRTSVMRYKGTNKTVPEIAKELNVDAVVEGAILRTGDRVRVTANLIHASTDRHLRGEPFDCDRRDVLALSNEIVHAIAQRVEVKLTPEEQTRLSTFHPVDPEAVELYLKGRDSQWRGQSKVSMQYFQQAVEKDPSFARGYLGLASAYSRLGHASEFPAQDAFAKVKSLGRKALDLDDGLVEGPLAIADGLIFGEWDWLGAERELRRAVEGNPNSDSARRFYSHYLSIMARHQEAIEEAKSALLINPRSAWSFHGLGTAYFFFRRYNQTLEQCTLALEVDPTFEDAHELSSWCYVAKGLHANALAEFTKVHPPSQNVPAIVGHLGNAYARAGERAEAHKTIQRLAEASKQKRGTYEVALIYAGFGDKDQAFEWLQRAFSAHDKGMCYLKVDPCLDPLRSDPRFEDLLRRMNFPP